MAGRGWADWFEREEFIGQISDMRVQNLQVEREVVQKRTFTRWINLHLEKCEPPIEVEDLFQDIQDGFVLMALLEELSGCKLLHGFKKSSHRIFRLNNIAKVLSFLEERNVKLVSIDAADVADGNASIILGLIWNIILFFQIKELTGNIRGQFPSSSSLSSIPTGSESDTSFCSTEQQRSASAAMREHNKAIKKLLQWVQKRTRRFGVAVQDFAKSWSSGLAFLAVIKSIDPSLVDMRKALLRAPRENLEEAFRTAHYSLGIPRLLEPEDVSINGPDEQSIITYVSQFLEHFPGLEEPEEPIQMMERSVSLCRLNLRDTDSDHRRNGAQGSRVKERSSRFQRDCGQAPPKILISSASQGGSCGPCPVRPAASRSWSTEDFRTEASLEEGGVRSKASLKGGGVRIRPHLEERRVRTKSSLEEGGVTTEASLEEGGVTTEASLEEGGVTTEPHLREGGVRSEASLEEGLVRSKGSLKEGGVRTQSPLEERGVRTEASLEEGGVRTEASLEEGGVRTEASLEEGGVRSEASLEEGGVRSEASPEEGGVRSKAALEEGGVTIEASLEEGGVRSKASLEEGGVRTLVSLEEGGSSNSVEAAPEVSQTWDSSLLTDIHSPTGSWVPESVTADSAISSPDCWLDTDFSAAPEKFSESRSDGSLCDSGTAWEVYRAVPVQITTLDEGFVPSPEAGLPEEQSCADEGIYSLSSLESTQDQGPSLTYEPTELNTSNHSQDVPLDQASDGGEFKTEVAASLLAEDVSKQEDLHQLSDMANVSADLGNQPIMSLSAGLPPPEEQMSQAAGGSKEAVKQSGDVQDHHQETATPTENQAEDSDSGDEDAKGQEGDTPSEETAETEMNKMEQWMMMTVDGTSEGLLRECQNPQVHASEDLLAPNTRVAIPLITVSSEEQQDGEEEGEPEGRDPAVLVELPQSEAAVNSGRSTDPESSLALEEPGQPSNVSAGAGPAESPTCMAAEEVQPRGAGPDSDQEPVNGNDLRMLPTAPTTLKNDEREDKGGCGPPQIHSPDFVGPSLALGTQLGSEVTGEDMLEDSSGPPTAAGRFPQMDLLPAAVDENSPTEELVGDPLEPMDLFYPDKDEPVFTEPPEAEAETWPSVLSVSALRPAPASRLFDDQPAEMLGHHIMNRDSQEAGEAPDLEERCSPSPERTGGLWQGVGLAEPEAGQQICCSPREKREDAELLRGSGGSEELLIAPVLRHRKGLLVVEATENPDAAWQRANREDGRDSATPELYLLLLLWLLLYCFWLFPQMEVKMLPKLLLNL